MRKFILSILILLYSTGLYAYTVSGRAVDGVTGNPVSDASVAIEELKLVQVTGADGIFVFKDIPAGYYTVHTAHTLYGNKSFEIRVKRNFKIDIDLPEKVYSIKTVVNPYRKNDLRQGSQSISSDDIAYMPLSGVGDSLHLLQTLPGVSGTFSMGAVPVIRGLNPVYDRIYIDDIPVDYPYHYIPPIVPLLSSINETVIDEAVLYKGAYPLTYDDSLGSIIQVRTKEVENPGVHGKIILNPVLPLFPTIYCEAAPTADFTLLFAGRRTYIDTAYEAVQIDTERKFYFQDYFLKMKYNYMSAHRFYLTAFGSDDYVSIKKYSAENEYQVEEFKWEYLISRKLFLETSFIRNRINHYFYDKNIDENENPINIEYSPRTYTLKQTLTSDLSVFDIKNGYEFIVHRGGVSGNVDISDFIEYDISKLSGGSANVSFPIEGNTLSLFNETGADLNPVHLNFGIRFKHYGPLSGNSLSFRGMASYNIQSCDAKIYGGGGAYLAQPDMYYYLGDYSGTLKESRSYNCVLGFEKKIGPDITGQVETYYSRYEDLFSVYTINTASTTLQRLSQINPYSKDKSGSAVGAEFFLKGRLGPVSGWASYSLAEARMSNGEDEYCSDYDRTHIFKLALLAHKGKWTPSIVWSYSTSMPYTPVTGSVENTDGGYDPVYGSRNSERYGAHHQLDFKISYTEGNVRYYAEIWNVYYIRGYDRDENEFILNETYIYTVFHKNNPYSSSNPDNQTDLPSSFIWAGVEICF